VECCIVGIDATGTIRFCNRFASERLAAHPDALIGASFVQLWVPEDRGAAQAQLRRALAGTPVRDYECSVQVELKRRRIRWTLAPLHGAVPGTQASGGRLDGGQPVLLGAGIDISDRVELERKTAENEAMAAMGTLTTALAHEIRNPLNAAKLQLELLERRARKLGDAEASAVLSEPAHLVRTEINRLANLLDEFLDLARPRQIERAKLSVEALIEQVVQLQRPLLERRHIAFETYCTPGLEVRGDGNKLKQVLINLLTNAVEALQEVDAPRIELRGERSASGVRLSVSDNGPGVPAELIGSAFTPFVTSKPSGTGLGLAVVQKIASQHGGYAELVARERGTIALIHLPDAQVQS
jgi:signal transduction histidine kinase